MKTLVTEKTKLFVDIHAMPLPLLAFGRFSNLLANKCRYKFSKQTKPILFVKLELVSQH